MNKAFLVKSKVRQMHKQTDSEWYYKFLLLNDKEKWHLEQSVKPSQVYLSSPVL